MWKFVGILMVGYAFIVLSYAWVWAIGAWMCHVVVSERMKRIERADVKAVAGMMLVWTIAVAVLFVVESF